MRDTEGIWHDSSQSRPWVPSCATRQTLLAPDPVVCVLSATLGDINGKVHFSLQLTRDILRLERYRTLQLCHCVMRQDIRLVQCHSTSHPLQQDTRGLGWNLTRAGELRAEKLFPLLKKLALCHDLTPVSGLGRIYANGRTLIGQLSRQP